MDNITNIDSILTSIKKLLGITEEYKHFDQDIITHINSVFLTLQQLGIGPIEGFTITDDTSIWTDFLDESPLLNSVKSYMYLKVRLLFDPPVSSSAIDSMNRIINEFEWRMNVQVEQFLKREEANQNG